MSKPKYRFTAYINGFNGIDTFYRQNIQSGVDFIIKQFKEFEGLRNATGRVKIFERRYRVSDRCLLWKPIKHMVFENGIYHLEDHEEDPVFEEKFWKHTTTE